MHVSLHVRNDETVADLFLVISVKNYLFPVVWKLYFFPWHIKVDLDSFLFVAENVRKTERIELIYERHNKKTSLEYNDRKYRDTCGSCDFQIACTRRSSLRYVESYIITLRHILPGSPWKMFPKGEIVEKLYWNCIIYNKIFENDIRNSCRCLYLIFGELRNNVEL